MPTNHCRHLKEDGAFCQMPALRERNYCFFHLRERGRRLRMAQEAARQRSSPLVLPPFEDMTAVNAGLTLVVVALAFRRIDQRTAGLLLYALQQAASNLKFMMTMAASSEAKDEREFVEEYPGFEAEFGLPEGFDVDTPPEVAFPPQPVEAMALLPDHPPMAFTWRRVRHRVRRADGPERIAGEWWKRNGETRSVRDYFRVEDEEGHRYWLFRRGDGENGVSGDMRWFLHGFF